MMHMFVDAGAAPLELGCDMDDFGHVWRRMLRFGGFGGSVGAALKVEVK